MSALYGKTTYEFKIIILGEPAVGKTSIINRFVTNSFSFQEMPSIGPESKMKMIQIDQTTVAKLNIWDTAGEEKFKSITRQYYKDAHGALVIYDVTNEDSFNKLEMWIKSIKDNGPRDCILFLVGNKNDSTYKVVNQKDVVDLALKYRLQYCEVSAKLGTNIAMAFEKLTFAIIEKQKEEENNPQREMRQKDRKSIGLKAFHNPDFSGLGQKKKCCAGKKKI